jgi:hypothetical protein
MERSACIEGSIAQFNLYVNSAAFASKVIII